MKQIKILHRASTFGFGGVEKYIISHYQHMDRERFKVDFITRNQHLNERQEIKDLNIKVQTFTATQRDNKDLLIKEITEILDQGYDVLHMNTSVWAGFLIEELAMERQIPKVIVHAHSTGVDLPTLDKRKFYQEQHEYYKKRFGKQYATHFCACSWAAADWMFGSQIPREEIHILKNAIEVEKYSFNEKKRKEIRRTLNLDGNFVIGHVGRFAYQKNHKFLIDVLKKIYMKNDKVILLLIGQGELEAEIKEQVDELGLKDIVLFLGWREDVNELMQAMDLFVLPSYFEGLPVVAIEAQAAGLPCILSDAITREICITSNIEMLPFDKEIWVEMINRYMGDFERLVMDKEVTAAGYNIKDASKKLEKLYL